jgi:hypothetical protein
MSLKPSVVLATAAVTGALAFGGVQLASAQETTTPSTGTEDSTTVPDDGSTTVPDDGSTTVPDDNSTPGPRDSNCDHGDGGDSGSGSSDDGSSNSGSSTNVSYSF